jgi:hypothetical protein
MDALAVLDVDDGQATLGRARAGDVPAIVAMLTASHEGMKLAL